MGQQERQAARVEEALRQARAFKARHRVAEPPAITAPAAQLGCVYGVGIGLYFKCIAWLRALLLWLALASVPFIVVVNTSVLTTEQYKGLAGAPGVSVLHSFNPLQSWTFAALMDDARDGGLLGWMNVRLPGIAGVFAMSRTSFLGWISIVDAASMALFSIACLVLYRWAARFVRDIDDATVEVSDFSIMVKGLPETTPIDIGQHFSRFGKVMDVVLVKDFGPLLHLASTATALEKQRKEAEGRLERGGNAVAYQRQVAATERRMAKFLQQTNRQLDSSGFPLKAVFVTFNRQADRAACQAACPATWLGSWLQHRGDRFLGKHRFWVEQAKPPEDFLYENLSSSRLARYTRMALVRLVVLVVLLVSALAVTKLMAISTEAARDILWQQDAMQARIATAMQDYPLTAQLAQLAPAAANATLAKIAEAAGVDTVHALQEQPGALEAVAYCSMQLEQLCGAAYSMMLGSSLSLPPTQPVAWASTADSFLKAPQLQALLTQCADGSQSGGGGGGACALSMCHPCHCSLLSRVASAEAVDSEWVAATRQECGAFISTLDLKTYSMKAVISMVVVALNMMLKAILQVLVRVEKHWTQSDQERAYAVLAFVSQLLNSVFVLLLVNARTTALNAVLNSSRAASSLALSGTGRQVYSYADFTPSWYIDVGQSLELIIVLNCVLAAAFAFGLWLLRKLQQRCLTSCVVTASQDAYNKAWQGMEFVLDYRVSDMMLGLWIILMFGSGMPGLYIFGLVWLLVLDVTDRWWLVRMCQQPVRYGKNLPFLLLSVLPWAAATHCAFGVWMHTRFYAGSARQPLDLSVIAASGSSAAVLQELSKSWMWRRITQLNGLPLLILLIVHMTIHVLIRSLLYFASGKAFKRCTGSSSNAGNSAAHQQHRLAEEVTYEAALLGSSSSGSAPGKDGGAAGGGGGSSSRVRLAGTPTYRLPHLPRYADLFEGNAMYKAVMFRAFGRLRFSHVVSRPGGGFQVSRELVLQHDDDDMMAAIASMPEDLQAAARQLADGGSDGSACGSCPSATKQRASLHAGTGPGLVTPRARSQSVHVSVLAGTGELHPSPRAHSASAVGAGGLLMPGRQRSSSVSSPTPGSAVHFSSTSYSLSSPLGIMAPGALREVVDAQQQQQQAQGFVAYPPDGAAYVLPPPATAAADPQQLALAGAGHAANPAVAAACTSPVAAAGCGSSYPSLGEQALYAYAPSVDPCCNLRQPAHLMAYAGQMQQMQVQQQPSAAAYPSILGATAPAAAPWPATAATGVVSCAQAGWGLERAGWQQSLPPQFNGGAQQQQQPCLWAGAMAAAAAADRRASGLTLYACQSGEQQQQQPSTSLAASGDQQHGGRSTLLAYAGHRLPFCTDPLLADAQAATDAYPNVHLTTVEMPAMPESAAVVAAAAAPAAATVQAVAAAPGPPASALSPECCVSSMQQPPALQAMAADSMGGARSLLQEACLVRPDGASLQDMPAAAQASVPQQCVLAVGAAAALSLTLQQPPAASTSAQAAVQGDDGCASSSGDESDGVGEPQQAAVAALLPAAGGGSSGSGGRAGKKQRKRRKGKKGKKRSG